MGENNLCPMATFFKFRRHLVNQCELGSRPCHAFFESNLGPIKNNMAANMAICHIKKNLTALRQYPRVALNNIRDLPEAFKAVGIFLQLKIESFRILQYYKIIRHDILAHMSVLGEIKSTCRFKSSIVHIMVVSGDRCTIFVQHLSAACTLRQHFRDLSQNALYMDFTCSHKISNFNYPLNPKE